MRKRATLSAAQRCLPPCLVGQESHASHRQLSNIDLAFKVRVCPAQSSLLFVVKTNGAHWPSVDRAWKNPANALIPATHLCATCLWSPPLLNALTPATRLCAPGPPAPDLVKCTAIICFSRDVPVDLTSLSASAHAHRLCMMSVCVTLRALLLGAWQSVTTPVPCWLLEGAPAH